MTFPPPLTRSRRRRRWSSENASKRPYYCTSTHEALAWCAPPPSSKPTDLTDQTVDVEVIEDVPRQTTASRSPVSQENIK